MTQQEQLKSDIITPPMVCSYPKLITKAEDASGILCYSLQVLIDSNDAWWSQLAERMGNAAVNKWGERYRNWSQMGVQHHILSGNQEDKYQAGKRRFSAKGFKDDRPDLRFKNMSEVPADQIGRYFYPGAIIRALISCYGTDKGGRNTLAFSLDAVVFWEHGDRIGGGVNVDDALKSIADPNYIPPSGVAEPADPFGGQPQQQNMFGQPQPPVPDPFGQPQPPVPDLFGQPQPPAADPFGSSQPVNPFSGPGTGEDVPF